jgi:hypothetical protein
VTSSNRNRSADGAIYRTDLAQTPLPEILATIERYKAPGVVECRRGQDVKKIYLEDGQIVFATSSDRADSLGDRLLREGKITRNQYDESVRLLRETGKRQGVILAEMKAIEPKALFVSLRDQIQDIVWAVFAWSEGAVTFTPGREKHLEFVKLRIPVLQAVLQGVRRMPDARALVARLGSKATLLARTEAAVEGVKLSEEEQRLLDLVDGKRVLFELVNTPPLAASDNARILYAFFAVGLIGVAESRQIKVQIKAPK